MVTGTPDPTTDELSAAVHAGRRPWALLGLAAVLAVAAGVFFFVVRPGEKVLPVAAIDAGLPAVVFAEPDAGDELTEEPDAGEALVAAAVAPDAGAGEPEVDAGTVAVAAVEPNPGIKKQGPKKKGRVNVITTHAGEPYWAQVSIDGVPRGRTPLLLDLPVGRYHVLIERPGFRSLTREIRVASGRAVVVKLELVP